MTPLQTRTISVDVYKRQGGTWLSDYVPNRLGGFLEKSELGVEKPSCPLIGQDGNIFNLVGIAARTLREAGPVSYTHLDVYKRQP